MKFHLNFCRILMLLAVLILSFQTSLSGQGNPTSTLCPLYQSQNFTPITPDYWDGNGIPYANSQIFWRGITLVQNQFYSLTCNLTIGSPITFKNCVFRVDGTSWRVLVNSKLILDNCTFYSCEGIWPGITVSSEIQVMNHTRIEDAQWAINPIAGSTISLENTDFNRNLVGLYFDGGPSTFSYFNLNKFSGNSFDCTSTLASDYCNTAYSYPAIWAIAGIMIKNSSFNLGLGGQIGSQGNRFENLSNGIIIDRARVDIAGCTFYNMKAQGTNVWSPFPPPTVEGCYYYYLYGYYFSGVGVSCSNGRVSVTGLGSSEFSTPTFSNNENGDVYGYRSGLRMTSVRTVNPGNYSVYFETLDGSFRSLDYYIDNCRFEMGSNETQATAIYLQRGPGNSLTVKNNKIIFTGKFASGIDIHQGYSNPTAIAQISNNIIDLYFSATIDFNSAIKLSANASNVRCFGNTVNNYSTNLINGIGLLGSTGLDNYVDDNHVLNHSGSCQNAFNIQGYQNVRYCQNETHGSTNGFRFYGDCSGTDWQSSMVGAHQKGLYLSDATCKLGEQFHYGNMWENENVYVGLNGIAAENLGNPTASPFEVSSLTPPLMPLPRSPGGFAWFEYELDNLVGCVPISQGEKFLKETERKVADGTISTIIANPSELWDLKRRLYRKLKAYPELVPTQSVFATFLITEETTGIGKFYEVEKLLQEAFYVSASFHQDYNWIQERSDTLHARLETIDNQFDADSEWIWDPQLTSEKETILDSLRLLSLQMQALLNAAHLVVIQKLGQAQALNNQVIVAQDFETYEQTLNDILTEWLLNEQSFQSETTLTEIRTIASQCLYDIGLVKFREIFMLPGSEQTTYLADLNDGEPECVGERNESNNLVEVNENKIKIFPVPATDYLNISLTNTDDYPLHIQIYDLNGRLLNSGTMTESGVFNLSGLQAGFYYLQVLTTSGEQHHGKFSIIK